MGTAKALRKPTKWKREPCYICGKHEKITEWHHLISLSECANKLFKNFDINELETPMYCLCPNCHTYIHLIESRKSYSIGAVIENLNSDEITKLKTLLSEKENLMKKILEKYFEAGERKTNATDNIIQLSSFKGACVYE